ncbi:MAG: hypothetical protein EOR30_12470 [Mesorhizobium sp.]|nr:hypothetical protein [Mesorhizobium sp.]RWF86091.1 MAG: hypothetical protein EOQ36_19440 [Mesorhizobium sp.]RWF92809.1 MAG: hypothetical protein EOQ45_19500 [Mesorhizobium sp.]RWI39330.1 MAG: hypothetical protein EOR14_19775 [Mesorhizobium sp.]RWI44869.1 MAG: hypothetical protein EOR15_24855 [Mesorhizobium sp.]RWI52601.1 MAG: hypothetical protein EOR16_26770 [Mesorhizobium sp.]
MFLLVKDAIKFSILVGLSAIFVDAAIAHGLLWENDPYWTYWITKTFLITTVFLFGTAFLGIGIIPGLVLTAVHTLILEIYYQWLAPVGLPQEPEWLDFNHLWITGVPVHFLAIFGGYLMALWLWRRNHPALEAERGETWRFVVYGLVTAVMIVAIDGILTQLLLLQDFPGITFFVQHILIAFVFVCVWTAYAGAGPTGWTVGALMLALVWTTYAMYLGPRGLPFEEPYYSGYRDLWWLSFPGGFVSALIGWWIAVWLMKNRRMIVVSGVGIAAAMLGLPADPAHAQVRGTDGLAASAQASGDGVRVTGADPVDMNSTQAMNGTIVVQTVEMGNRWSHVQNTDEIHVSAEFTTGDASYAVRIDKPMPRHPLGRYTTWSGAVYEHEMHGDTGIGTAKLPKMRPKIALWGWAEVRRNGEVIARAAPAHVMVVTDGPIPGVMLEIDTEDNGLAAEPDGYINVMWHKVEALQMPEGPERTRQIIGWIGIIAFVALFGGLAAFARVEHPKP